MMESTQKAITDLEYCVARYGKEDSFTFAAYQALKEMKAMQSRLESLEKDAALFRKLAYHMRFTQDGDHVTMDFACPVDATLTHDVHKDFIEPWFTESVRRTLDAAMKG